jgi:hypothetical protein
VWNDKISELETELKGAEMLKKEKKKRLKRFTQVKNRR